MFDAKSLLDTLVTSLTAPGGAVQQAGQAVGGVAGSAGTMTSGALSQAAGHFQGGAIGDLLSQAARGTGENPQATGAALGGLAAVLLGTSGGRAVTGDAAKLGGLAVLGGLAYKAFSNYQAGKPLTAGVPVLDQLTGASAGTGFHPDDHSHDSALLLIKTMIATAAADGAVDAGQRAEILQGMQQAGLPAEAATFLDQAIARPASPAELAADATTPELAASVYAAAHLIAHPASPQEQTFLAQLAMALKLDPAMVQHIDAAVPAHG